MPGLNGNINGRSRNNNNGNLMDNITKQITFTRVFAVILGVLTFKQHREDQREEQEHRSTLLTQGAAAGLNPPPYRDNPSSEDLVGLNSTAMRGDALADEELGARPTRKRKPGCCVCFGIHCDLIFKALGIAILLYLGWGVLKLAKWALTPSPTGLENMPEFSKSLGCEQVPYLYENDIFKGVLPTNQTTLVLDISGAGVGTVLLTSSDAEEIKISMSIKSNEEGLLEKVMFSQRGDPEDQTETVSLTTPSSGSSDKACLRFDVVVHIPASLNMLAITSKSVVHVKYDELAAFSLSDLTIDLKSLGPDNLLLPSRQLEVQRTKLAVRGGYLVGSIAFEGEAEIDNAYGSATTNLKVFPLAAPDNLEMPAELKTRTGTGRLDIIYANPDTRLISSSHTSSGGDMYLTYNGVGYNGRVDVQAGSYRASGLQGSFGRVGGSEPAELPWVGDKEGPDHMKIRTPGWVGLWF
ncbi:hypothetical protein M422DRAFT_257791 [Sphaerobolus stellatus SS14]|uniref:Adhesin domain-containing protein n=1 Tax=Sphaerobolus stellatus (strain SS14) TaxID=990650 RepID=A0A0C9U8U8_SPHS4|nr:hypothetical protein M422DRAFT_257791 [Sphaerobolus stellatus SS14]